MHMEDFPLQLSAEAAVLGNSIFQSITESFSVILETILLFKSVILSPSVVSADTPLQEEGLVTTHPHRSTGATADPGGTTELCPQHVHRHLLYAHVPFCFILRPFLHFPHES